MPALKVLKLTIGLFSTETVVKCNSRILFLFVPSHFVCD